MPRRATAKVRHLVKDSSMDSLSRLTYRTLQTDFAACKRHMKDFARHMRPADAGWSYVAAFKRQARGAGHVRI